MKNSKRHHYIPQFYLRGFTNENDEFYVFDKNTGEIRKGKPENTFYEKYRNTGTIKEDKSVLLEEMYSHFDGKAAPYFEKLRNSTVNDFIWEPEILYELKMFVSLMYWRVPEIDEEFEKTINRLSFKESGFDFIDKKTKKSIATEELQSQLKEVDLFRKMYRIFLPFITIQKEYKKNDFENWRIYFRGNKLQLTSDNPLVIEKFVDFSSLNEELFFPITNNKILVHTERPKPKDLPSMFILDLDMLILQQATRFVCCSDKFYLEYLVNNLYPYSNNFDFIDKMKERVFGHFK